jgi:hypothetical protein
MNKREENILSSPQARSRYGSGALALSARDDRAGMIVAAQSIL